MNLNVDCSKLVGDQRGDSDYLDLGYTILMAFTIWLLTGVTGFYASYGFITQRIYSSIKVEWVEMKANEAITRVVYKETD